MTNTIAEIPTQAVSCRQVKKEFGNGDNRALVLRGVDFDARFGEMTLLVGPSGCGKTTLLSVIAGLLDATDGEISVLGQKMNELSGASSVLFRRKNLGFVGGGKCGGPPARRGHAPQAGGRAGLQPACRLGIRAPPPRPALSAIRRSAAACRAGPCAGA